MLRKLVTNRIAETDVARGRPLDLWRSAFLATFVVTLIRISPIGGGEQEGIWLVLQLGPLAVATIVAVLQSRSWYFGLIGWALTGWATLVVSSAIWSVFPASTLRQAGLLVLVFGFLAVTASTRWLDRDRLVGDLAFFFWLIAGAASAGLVLWLVDTSGAMGYFGRYQGVFPNPNYAAITAALGVPLGAWILVVDKRRLVRAGVLVALVVFIATLVATGSRGPLAAMFIGLVVAAWFSPYRRKAIYVALALVVAGGAVLAIFPTLFFGRGGFLDRTANGSDFTSGRIEIWANLLEYWQRRPIIGSGYRTVELLPSSEGFTAHNIYLSALAELGIIGLCALLALFVILVVSGFRSPTPTDRMLAGAAVAILACDLTEASLFGFGGPTAALSWSVLVAFAALGRAVSGGGSRGRAIAFSRRGRAERRQPADPTESLT